MELVTFYILINLKMETLGYTQMIFSAIFGKPKQTLSKTQRIPALSCLKAYEEDREMNIKILEQLCERFSAPVYIKHICVGIYDQVNRKQKFSQCSKYRLLLICLYLAYKYENDEELITQSELIELDPMLTANKILELELQVMDLIDWKINRKNSVFFIYEICRKTIRDHKLGKVVSHACTLADLTLRMKEFFEVDSKIIACTCLAFAFKKLGIKNYWTKNLERVSGVSINSLKVIEIEAKYNQVISACNSN